jgi:hypothetical protein
MPSYLAMITIIDQAGGGQPPLSMWGPGTPSPMPPIYHPPGPVDPGYSRPIGPGGPVDPGYSHPIRPPGTAMPPIYYPPSIWGGGNYPLPTPPIYHPPGPVDPGYSHPLPPPGTWGGTPPHTPMPPIYLPPGTIPGLKPEHPIYIPPTIWGPGDPRPTHPIVLPPPGSDEKPEVLENWDVKSYWSPATGWGIAIVPTEQHPGVPTPSSA